MQFNSIRPKDRDLSGATIPGQSRLGSNGNEGVLRMSQNLSITGTSPSDCFESFTGHSLGGTYSSSEVQSMYSIAPAYRLIYKRIQITRSAQCIIIYKFINFIQSKFI